MSFWDDTIQLLMIDRMKDIKLLPYNNKSKKEIEIIEIGKTQSISTTVTIPYRTDFYQIIWLKKGVLSASINFEEIIIQPNTVLFINKNKIQSYSAQSKVLIDIILFTDTFYNKYMTDNIRIEKCLLFSDLTENSFIKADNPNFQVIKDILFDEYFNHSDSFSMIS